MRWPREWSALTDASAAEREAGLQLWTKAGAALDADISVLRRGLYRGEAAPASVVRRVAAQVEEMRAQLRTPAPGTSPGGTWENAWARLVASSLRPAIDRYADFLASEYLPKASVRDGLSGTPAGRRCFADAVVWWTTLEAGPTEIEQVGRRLLAETRAQIAKAAGISETELPKLLTELRRGEGASETTVDDLLSISRAAIVRAETALPLWFSSVPATTVVVEPMQGAIEASFPAGFYRAASQASPAAYVINTSRPAERRLMAEAIAFHETLPGHHLSRELQRSSPSESAYNAGLGEGWAIYAEYLADEMGLYATPADRLGMMAKHLWAASRLIIEPGLHLRGWSRREAIAFMRANTALSEQEIEIEIDRYIAMPGQSLAYMLGYDQLRQARADAERRLGSGFDIRGFHQVVLGGGMRDLARVTQDVRQWVTAQTNRPPTAPTGED